MKLREDLAAAQSFVTQLDLVLSRMSLHAVVRATSLGESGLSNRPIVLSDANEVTIEVVAGRDVSANFDMQSLASLQHGDRILVSRAHHSVRFLHPKGWNYFATLRKKLGWNEGGA